MSQPIFPLTALDVLPPKINNKQDFSKPLSQLILFLLSIRLSVMSARAATLTVSLILFIRRLHASSLVILLRIAVCRHKVVRLIISSLLRRRCSHERQNQ